MPRHSRTSTAPRGTMRDGAAARADPSARSSVNSSSRRRVEGLRPPKAFSWRRYAIARVRNDRLISRDGALPNMAFQRSRISSVPSFDRLAISDASASRPIEAARRFMIVSLDVSQLSNRLPSSYVVLLEAGDSPPDDTHIARFAARSQSCPDGDFGQCQLLPGLVFSAAIPIRLPIALIVAGRRCAPIAAFFLSAANGAGKMVEIARFTLPPEQTSRRAHTAQGDLERNGTS